jgi:NADH-quinone oxidoreductase subunit L
MMLLSAAIVFIGIGVGYRLYGRKPPSSPEQPDVLETRWPNLFTLLKRKYYVDEAYDWAVVGLNAWWAKACDWMDRWVWSGVVQLISLAAIGLAWVDRLFDELVINGGFDQICRRLKIGGQTTSRLQNGQVQRYLRIIGIGMALLTLALIWGCRSS